MQYKNSKSRSPSSSTFVECYKKQQVHYNDKLQMWLLFLLSWPEIWSIHNDKKCSPIMTFTVTSLIEVLAPLKNLFSLIEKKKKVWTKRKMQSGEKNPSLQSQVVASWWDLFLWDENLSAFLHMQWDSPYFEIDFTPNCQGRSWFHPFSLLY